MLRIWVPTDTYISWFALHLATGIVVSCQNWVDYFSTDKTCFKACPQFDSIAASHHFYAATNDSVDTLDCNTYLHTRLARLDIINTLHATLSAVDNLITIDTKMREPWTICSSSAPELRDGCNKQHFFNIQRDFLLTWVLWIRCLIILNQKKIRSNPRMGN